ncbi:MAG: hypothetical protein OXC40_06245 [Proteobacteria bacterium]|nr:hypothetical protein [Pseudomonadota bacterium]
MKSLIFVTLALITTFVVSLSSHSILYAQSSEQPVWFFTAMFQDLLKKHKSTMLRAKFAGDEEALQREMPGVDTTISIDEALEILQADPINQEIFHWLHRRFPALDDQLSRSSVAVLYMIFKGFVAIGQENLAERLGVIKRVSWDGYEGGEGDRLLTQKNSEQLSQYRLQHLKIFINSLQDGLLSQGYFTYSNYYTKSPSLEESIVIFFMEDLDLFDFFNAEEKNTMMRLVLPNMSQEDVAKIRGLIQRELVMYSYKIELLSHRDALSNILSIDDLKIALDYHVYQEPLHVLKRLTAYSSHISRDRLTERAAFNHLNRVIAAAEEYRRRIDPPKLAFSQLFSQELYGQVANFGVLNEREFVLHVYISQILKMQNISMAALVEKYPGASEADIRATSELIFLALKAGNS